MHASGLGLQITRYYVLQCLGQTCTGIIYIQEVLYILHLSCARPYTGNVVDQTTSTVTALS